MGYHYKHPETAAHTPGRTRRGIPTSQGTRETDASPPLGHSSGGGGSGGHAHVGSQHPSPSHEVSGAPHPPETLIKEVLPHQLALLSSLCGPTPFAPPTTPLPPAPLRHHLRRRRAPASNHAMTSTRTRSRSWAWSLVPMEEEPRWDSGSSTGGVGGGGSPAPVPRGGGHSRWAL